MKKIVTLFKTVRFYQLVGVLLGAILINACTNDFDYKSNNKPEWLGESIYEQLEQGYTDAEGRKYEFATFLRLVNDLEYDEVLKKTGSKTIFASDDEAFKRFYQSNNWGVSSYEGLSLAQKKLIFNSAMINNAYLIELMSSTEGPVEGQALRRVTAVSYLDTLTYEAPEALPLNSTWDRFRESGIYLFKDNSEIPMLHFLQKQMDFKGIKDEDFSYLFNGKTRQKGDAHIYGIKVIVKDITCKNGYINILEDVLVPPSNMAEVIRTSPETQLYSSFLERFAAPYFVAGANSAYKLLNPGFTDSIFVKRYYAERSLTGANLNDPKGNVQSGYLEFDPGWNTYAYSSGANMQVDMGVMFVPTDDAINNYFTSGGGKFLLERYKEIDSIPNSVIVELIRNMMKSTFNGTVPSKFDEILDDGKEPMGVDKSHLVKTYVANNGVVYVMDKVYAPASYVAVTAPVLINSNTRIINWGVKAREFDAYLLSMDSRYSFIVPEDDADITESNGSGFYYIDPVAYAKEQPEIFKFRFDQAKNNVVATVYEYNLETGEIGDSLRLATAAEVNNRMDDILDYHVVVGDIEDGKEYYQTKGGGTIKVTRNGGVSKLCGGGNIEKGCISEITQVYDQTKETNGRGNGKTYLVNAPLLPPYKSVYSILKDNPDFSEFFTLLEGNDEWTEADTKLYSIFYSDPKLVGMDFNVRFFNTFHYSVYIPTNEAVDRAIRNGLPTWEQIKLIPNQEEKDSLSEMLSNFLRYHFQDNSIFVDGKSSRKATYETAAYTLTGKKAYYKLDVELSPSDLKLKGAGNSGFVNVTSSARNIMARDYKFNNSDIQKATAIETSSWAVIHQIDDVLIYDASVMQKMKQMTNRAKAKKK